VARIVGAGLADQFSFIANSDRQNPPVPDGAIGEDGIIGSSMPAIKIQLCCRVA
jgi:hypothetical protein